MAAIRSAETRPAPSEPGEPGGSAPRSRRRLLPALLLLLALLAAACSSGDSSEGGVDRSGDEADVADESDAEGTAGGDDEGGEGERTRPAGIGTDGVDEWPVVEPAEVGLDADVLAEMAGDAEAQDSACLVIARDGHIAAEHYWNDGEPDIAREVFSVTKSFTSMLVGIAVDDGALEVDDPASTWIPEWRDGPSSEVTVDELLSNDSGREWSLSIDYGQMAVAPDRTGFAIDLGQEAEPGDVWVYNNSAIQTLDRVIEGATGRATHEFGTRRLLEPLGMDDSRFSTDPSGNTLTFMGLRSTCRDLARFGVMLLAGGTWNGEPIVSEEWIDAAVEPSQDLTSAYGRLIWLNRDGPVASAIRPMDRAGSADAPETRLVPGRPETLRWALGLGGQIVQIDPDGNTVVVRLGPAELGDPTGAGGEGYGPHLSAKVLDAITDPAPVPDERDVGSGRGGRGNAPSEETDAVDPVEPTVTIGSTGS